jgi:GTP-binding protein
MALIDEIRFFAKAGKGGDGVVRWRNEKFIAKGGPNGGDGGWGGSVYVVGVRDNTILGSYKKTDKKFAAGPGQAGQSQSKHGSNGSDIEIKLPVGCILTNESTGETFEILNSDEKIMILAGGKGGFGNEHFKSSLNVAPEESTEGKSGEESFFTVELRMIADAGLIGFPSAGKSSLLNILTSAQAKVGNYAFTTLDPNLGVFGNYILADLPGLIEGASQGRGLGHKFLRHTLRTKVLVHLVSCEETDTATAYNTIRGELGAHDVKLLEKEEIVALSKTDQCSQEEINIKKEQLEKACGKQVILLSLYDDEKVKNFKEVLFKILSK